MTTIPCPVCGLSHVVAGRGVCQRCLNAHKPHDAHQPQGSATAADRLPARWESVAQRSSRRALRRRRYTLALRLVVTLAALALVLLRIWGDVARNPVDREHAMRDRWIARDRQPPVEGQQAGKGGKL